MSDEQNPPLDENEEEELPVADQILPEQELEERIAENSGEIAAENDAVESKSAIKNRPSSKSKNVVIVKSATESHHSQAIKTSTGRSEVHEC